MNVTCSVQTHTQTEKGRKGEVCGTLQSVEEVFVCVCVCVLKEGRSARVQEGGREMQRQGRTPPRDRSGAAASSSPGTTRAGKGIGGTGGGSGGDGGEGDVREKRARALKRCGVTAWTTVFEASVYRARLAPVVKELCALGHATDATEAVACLHRLVDLNEIALGKDVAPSSRPFPKLPMHVFVDLSVNGAVQHMLEICHASRKKYKWSHSFSFGLEAGVGGVGVVPNETMLMLREIRDVLVKMNFIVYPKVFLSETVAEEDAKTSKLMVGKLRGSIVSQRENATHVIETSPLDSYLKEKSDAFFRIVGGLNFPGSGDMVLLHCVHSPESMDMWVNPTQLHPDRRRTQLYADRKRGSGIGRNSCFANFCNDYIADFITADAAGGGGDDIAPVVTCVDWLVDSVHYNEFMNVHDYEREAGGEPRLSSTLMTSMIAESDVKDACPLPTIADVNVHGGTTVKTNGAGVLNTVAVGGKRDRQTYEDRETESSKVLKQPISELPIDVQAAAQVTAKGAVSNIDMLALENISNGQQQAEPVIPPLVEERGGGAAGAAAEDGGAALPATATAVAAGAADDQKPATPGKELVEEELYRVPAYAAWFRWDSIHEIERRGNHEFFISSSQASSKNARLYKEYRDFMINKFREKPSRRLTFTECRRYLSGDAPALLRVFRFLESWGLLNYFPGSASRANLEQPIIVSSDSTPSGFEVNGGNKRAGIADLYHLKHPGVAGGAHAARTGHAVGKQKASVSEHMVLGTRDPLTLPKPKRCCNIHATLCTKKYYIHTNTTASAPQTIPAVAALPTTVVVSDPSAVVVCPECFASGNFPNRLCSADFMCVCVAAEPPPPAQLTNEDEHDRWTNEETLLLLEALEMHGDSDWNTVAEYVGTKSAYQCVVQFLQIPIDDEFIEDYESGAHPLAAPSCADEETDLGTQTDTANGLRAASPNGMLPFQDSSNPVMSQIAFLTAVVGPRVAAAAAQAALATLAEENPVIEADDAEVGASGERDVNGTADATKRGDEDPMETDVQGEAGPAPGAAPAAQPNAVAPDATDGFSDAQIKVAAATALASGAVKAKMLADKEERIIQQLTLQAIEKQLKKIHMKITSCERLDEVRHHGVVRFASVFQSFVWCVPAP